MGESKRFDVFYDRHIGFGIRWHRHWGFPWTVSIAFPFFTVNIGIGKKP